MNTTAINPTGTRVESIADTDDDCFFAMPAPAFPISGIYVKRVLARFLMMGSTRIMIGT